MHHMNTICLVLCLAVLAPTSIGYNLDLGSYIRHSSPQKGSMFGFSIALHKANRASWIIIGAPKGNTAEYQEGVEKAGAVYRCDVQVDDRCTMIPFDSKGNTRNQAGEQIDTKSNQWLGATVSSSGENGVIVACAPRYVYHHMQPKKVERIEPVGTCFTSKNFTSFTEFSPCRNNFWGYHRQGSCQAGFSAALSKNGDRLYIGAPGSWYWQGQAFSINTDARYPYKPQWYQEFGTGGQIFSQDIGNPKHNVFHTGESSELYDDSYLGYSMTTGDFDGDGEEDVAIGMPRGSELLGRIVINKWNMVNIVNITGWQLGAYFGYSLCSVDVDGDQLTDLIIGAPMYSEQNNEGKYEVGRVYIMMQSRKNNFMKEVFRDGVKSRSRFGTAVTSLNDINLDGYGDFAVGAPYDGPEGRGAVYIYHGSKDGPLEKPSQIIYAEDLVGISPPRTFGFALSGGVDIDGNLYPDLGVGAYDSDNVLVFKSRPVAQVTASAQFTSPSKLISLDEKRCALVRYGKNVACTDVESCIRYNGVNLPPVLDFEVSWVLDSKKTRNPRMFFLRDENKNIRNSTYRLERGKLMCVNETVYLVEGITDKLTPLEVEMSYYIRGSRAKVNYRRKRDLLEPVIDQNRENVQRDSINIQKNCGSDNICIPDLRLQVISVDKFLLGSKDPLTVEAIVSNFGEDAFEAAFYMNVPPNLHFKKMNQIVDAKDTPISCSPPTPANNNTIKCDLGNPLPAKKVARFNITMIPTQKSGMAPSYDFFMTANSTNAEVEGSTYDNIFRKSIGVWVQTDLAIEGISLPDFEHYKASDYKSIENSTKEEDLGPQVVHIYNVRNNGPSTIDEAEVLIHYPYHTQGDDILMYLLNQPETSGNIYCEPNINVNPKNLQLDSKLSRKSFLEQIGAITSRSSASAYHRAHIEQSHGSRISGNAITTNKVLTSEENDRLKKDEVMESTADGSFIHNQRAKDAVASSSSSSSYYDGSHAVQGGGPSKVVYTSSQNRSISYDNDGVPHVVESSTEYYKPMTYSSQMSGGSQRSGGLIQPGSTQHVTYNMDSQKHNAGGSSFNDFGSSSNFDNAARGQGFRSGTVDLGTLNRNNAENEVRRQGASSSDHVQFGAGQGFRTGTLDLGTLNRGSGENELRRQNEGASSHVQYGGSTSGQGFRTGTLDLGTGNQNEHRSSSGGHVQYGTPSGSHYSSSYRSQSPASGGYYQHSSSGGNNAGESAGSAGDYVQVQTEYHDNFPTNKQYSTSHQQNFGGSQEYSTSQKHNFGGQHDYGRRKRDVESEILESAVPCKATKCATLRCVVKDLGHSDGAWIAIRTRLVAKTVEKIAPNVALNISTMAVSQITKLPYIGAPKDKIIKSHEIFYKAIPEPVPEPDVVPLWVVVLAACAGALILLLLIFLLYKCGFFKRNRPSGNSQERQPLNGGRNGYHNHHGDEHL